MTTLDAQGRSHSIVYSSNWSYTPKNKTLHIKLKRSSEQGSVYDANARDEAILDDFLTSHHLAISQQYPDCLIKIERPNGSFIQYTTEELESA
jgi:hypothetical protein